MSDCTPTLVDSHSDNTGVKQHRVKAIWFRQTNRTHVQLSSAPYLDSKAAVPLAGWPLATLPLHPYPPRMGCLWFAVIGSSV